MSVSESARRVVKVSASLSRAEMMALDDRAWAAWNAAWDAARDADVEAGRLRYDRNKYSDAASEARAEVYRRALPDLREELGLNKETTP